MTLQDLGSIGEFVGAFAVVLSMLYLAVQIRQNTAELKRSAFRDVHTTYSELRRLAIESPEISRLHFTALNDPESLSVQDTYRLEQFLTELGWASDQLLVVIETRLFPAKTWPLSLEFFVDHLESQAGQAWWNRTQEVYSSKLAREVAVELTKRRN